MAAALAVISAALVSRRSSRVVSLSRAVPDVGRLALLLGRAGVDRAVELVVRQLAGDVLA
jgi:hypothetical protein